MATWFEKGDTTMTINPATIAEVVGELTELERRAVLASPQPYRTFGPRDISAWLQIPINAARLILRRLRELGVVDYGPLIDHDEYQTVGGKYWLDLFGQAVREALHQQGGMAA
jgi:transcription initiation factor IIE alpha subunit